MTKKKCDNPMRRKHKGKSEYSDVKIISANALKEAKELLPEFEWDPATRLCTTCRLYLNHTITARRQAGELMQNLRAVIDEHSGEGAAAPAEAGQAAPPQEIGEAAASSGNILYHERIESFYIDFNRNLLYS